VFEKERSRLGLLHLPDTIFAIDTGNTSIPQMSAKSIRDILAGVDGTDPLPHVARSAHEGHKDMRLSHFTFRPRGSSLGSP
jgi:hypothetical protein